MWKHHHDPDVPCMKIRVGTVLHMWNGWPTTVIHQKLTEYLNLSKYQCACRRKPQPLINDQWWPGHFKECDCTACPYYRG